MSILATCERCRAAFDPLTGGICARCGRLLCGRHLRGRFFSMFFAALERAQPVCPECRAARREAHGGADGRPG